MKSQKRKSRQKVNEKIFLLVGESEKKEWVKNEKFFGA